MLDNRLVTLEALAVLESSGTLLMAVAEEVEAGARSQAAVVTADSIRSRSSNPLDARIEDLAGCYDGETSAPAAPVSRSL